MANLMQLRIAAREILNEAIRAVDAGAAARKALRYEGSQLTVGNSSFEFCKTGRVYSIGIGKASAAMALALQDCLGAQFVSGIISAPANSLAGERLSDRWHYFEGGHPLPNDASLAAGKAARDLLDRANGERALVIFLISGGGSAMIEWPIDKEMTLADLRVGNQVLIASGASIAEVNAVRRTFSAVKGGKLAARAPNCEQVTLIVSDVLKGQEYNVASGPTLVPPKDAPSAAEVANHYRLRERLPLPILHAIDHAETPEPSKPDSHQHVVLLDNETATEAAATAARGRGFAPEVAQDISDEQVEVGVQHLLTRLREITAPDKDVCLISGGEFACPVRGDGIGGRNLETALRLAIAAEQNRDRIGKFVALCAGTDGIDGNSPAAGAIVDSTTIERARRIGLDPNDFLNRSDAYSFFVALGDVITTGPTGTNVRDLRILLAG